MEPAERHNSFDILRLCGAALVFYSHSFPLLGLPGTDAVSDVLPATDAGVLGVHIFFSISGFLNAQSVQRNSAGVFLINRALRIFPALLIVLILSSFILGPFATSMPWRAYFQQPMVFAYVYQNALLSPHFDLPGVFTDNLYKDAVNGSLWTLPAEVSLYLILPLVLRGRGETLARCVLLAAGFLGLNALSASIDMDNIQTFGLGPISAVSANAAVFFIGAAIGCGGWRVRTAKPAAWLLALLILTSQTLYAPIALLVLLPLLVIAFGSLDLRALRLKHDISYGLYIYAFPVQQMTYHLLSARLPAYAMAIIALPVAAVLAAGSWFLVERPIMRNRRWIIAKLGPSLEADGPSRV